MRVSLIAGVLMLAAGTYGFRLAGPALRSRITFPARAERLLETASVVVLTALMTVMALTQDHGFAGYARPLGVLVGGVLAWRKAPFLVAVLAAAGTAALLRVLGVHLPRGHIFVTLLIDRTDVIQLYHQKRCLLPPRKCRWPSSTLAASPAGRQLSYPQWRQYGATRAILESWQRSRSRMFPRRRTQSSGGARRPPDSRCRNTC
jgi:branched-subunit amino acid transport protein